MQRHDSGAVGPTRRRILAGAAAALVDAVAGCSALPGGGGSEQSFDCLDAEAIHGADGVDLESKTPRGDSRRGRYGS